MLLVIISVVVLLLVIISVVAGVLVIVSVVVGVLLIISVVVGVELDKIEFVLLVDEVSEVPELVTVDVSGVLELTVDVAPVEVVWTVVTIKWTLTIRIRFSTIEMYWTLEKISRRTFCC